MMDPSSIIWTFLPGLHGTADLFDGVKDLMPTGRQVEYIELPQTGKQDYKSLSSKISESWQTGQKRLLIAESFSGPLAIRLAALDSEDVIGVVLVSSFCDAPINPGFAMLPLRPLFMVKPSRATVKHFLIGDDASSAETTQLLDAIGNIPSSTLAKRVRTVLNLEERDNPSLRQVPMLILQAHNDNLVPWEAQSRLIASYPHADVHWIESPHLMLQRKPGQCLQLIDEFLAEGGPEGGLL